MCFADYPTLERQFERERQCEVFTRNRLQEPNKHANSDYIFHNFVVFKATCSCKAPQKTGDTPGAASQNRGGSKLLQPRGSAHESVGKQRGNNPQPATQVEQSSRSEKDSVLGSRGG